MITFFLALLLANPADSVNESNRPLSCGQSSVFLLLSQLGCAVPLDELDREFRNQTADASFTDLQRALNNFGVNASAWRVTWSDFQKIQGPMICHLAFEINGLQHFHVAEWRGSELVVLDPLAAHPILLTADQFSHYQKAFRGEVLVPISGVPMHWRIATHSKTVFIVAIAGLLGWYVHRQRLLHPRKASRFRLDETMSGK